MRAIALPTNPINLNDLLEPSDQSSGAILERINAALDSENRGCGPFRAWHLLSAITSGDTCQALHRDLEPMAELLRSRQTRFCTDEGQVNEFAWLLAGHLMATGCAYLAELVSPGFDLVMRSQSLGLQAPVDSNPDLAMAS